MKAISDYKKPLFVVSVVLIALAILNTAFDYGQQLIITAASSALGVILLMAVTYVVVTEFKANWDAKFSELMATQDSIQKNKMLILKQRLKKSLIYPAKLMRKYRRLIRM